MRFTTIILCLLICAATLEGAGPPPHLVRRGEIPLMAAAMPQDDIASVSGTVADGSSKPLAGAIVSIRNAAGVTQTAKTDSKGKYCVGSLAAGTYTISVSAKGYKKFEVADIPLAAGDSVPLDVLMEVGTSEEPTGSAESAAGTAATAQTGGAGATANNAQAQTTAPNWLYVAPAIPPPPPGAKAPITVEQAQPAITEKVNNGGKTASVTGNVTDPTGALIANATVTVTNSAGFKQTATSNAQGAYTLTGLPPGTYDLSVSAPNFKTFQTSSITFNAGDIVPMDASLEAAGAKTEISVEANNAAAVETENAEVSGTITQKEVTALQLNGRNFTQLITLTPGVSNQTGQDEAKVGVNGSVKYSVNGGRVEYNSFEVDGSDVLNAGLSGAESTLVVYPSLDAIQEIKVLTSNYGAQYGRTASGTVQVTTKSGTSQFHGDAYEFFRNEFFNARNYFDQTKRAPTYRRNDFGGTFGGPLWIPGHYNENKAKDLFLFLRRSPDRKISQRIAVQFQPGSTHAGGTAGKFQRRLSESV